MHCANVPFEVPGRLEAVVANVAHEVVVLVDAPDVIVQIRATLELFAASEKTKKNKKILKREERVKERRVCDRKNFLCEREERE